MCQNAMELAEKKNGSSQARGVNHVMRVWPLISGEVPFAARAAAPGTLLGVSFGTVLGIRDIAQGLLHWSFAKW